MSKIIIVFIIISFIGCKDSDLKPFKVPYTVVTDDIYTRLPGKLLLQGDYLIWQDPFDSKDFIKVIDSRSGKQVGEAGIIGKGPEEFITPAMGNCIHNEVLVYDLNSSQRAFFKIDSIIRHKKYYTPLPLASVSKRFPIIATDSVSFIITHDSLPSPLQFIKGDSVVQVFGEAVISGDFNNRPDYFQVNLFYDAYKGYLICLYPYLSHISLYTNKDDVFSLYSQKRPARYDYSIENHQIKIKEPDIKILDIALTQDYIVTIEINKENTRNTSNLPSTLCLYDYHFRLQHIIDLEVPLLRLAADSRSNTLYAIAVNEGYSIIQCLLPPQTH
ncbi:MAG: hypothetical protein NC410_01595 [Oscillibacter sp.]|nr:hypothetical protein [Oscillibacter sp.]